MTAANTPQQQHPKEYIITEEQLRTAVTLTDWNKISDLCSAIRSRPHPAPQAPVATLPTCNYAACRIFEHCANAYDDNESPPCTKYQSKEHDAAIARKAREKVLDELLEYINPHSNAGLVISSFRSKPGGQEQPR